jgi:hypothetical protein
MRNRPLILSLVVGLALSLAVPGVALAKTSKAPTKITGIAYEYVVPASHAPGQGATISGKLLYRAMYRKNGKVHGVYKPMPNGLIRLYRENDTNGQWKGVAETHVVNGTFSFNEPTRGWYRIQFGGTKNRTASYRYTDVYEDVLTLTNFKALSGSLDASGNEFVVLGANVGAPAGVITSATPGEFLLYSGNIFGPMGLAATKLTATGPTFPSYSLHYQTISSPGTYKIGFTIPSESINDTITAEAVVEAEYVIGKSATTSVTPSALLP